MRRTGGSSGWSLGGGVKVSDVRKVKTPLLGGGENTEDQSRSLMIRVETLPRRGPPFLKVCTAMLSHAAPSHSVHLLDFNRRRATKGKEGCSL